MNEKNLLHAELPVSLLDSERFRLLEKIGEGSLAHIWAASDVDASCVVALKILKKEFVDNSQVFARFLRENVVGLRFRHTNLAAIVSGIFDVAVQPYYAMELVPGEPVSTFLARDGALAAGAAVAIAHQVLSALRYLHGAGVVHRDVKPDNVMMSADENGLARATLLDFGLLRRVVIDPDNEITPPSISMGTPKYIPPEALQFTMHSSPSFDVYAVGVLLYETLCAAHPFEAPSESEMRERAIHGAPTPMRAHVRNVDAVLEEICLRALAHSPDERFESAQSMMQALDEWIACSSAP